jgi:hypothetical protein
MIKILQKPFGVNPPGVHYQLLNNNRLTLIEFKVIDSLYSLNIAELRLKYPNTTNN